MRRILLVIFIIAAAIFFFLVAAVNDDIKWFHNFSKGDNAKFVKSFQAFDFTYNDVFSTCFSIKFLQCDTALIRQHFASSFSDTIKSQTSYYTLLSKADRLTLDSFINTIPFDKYDTSYYQDYQDGIDYEFFIQKDTIKKSIRVHSDSVPSALTDFKNWIVKRKQTFKLHQVDTTIHFEGGKFILQPPILLPPLDFTVPRTKNSR